MEEDQPTRHQEIEIAFSEESPSEESSVLSSSESSGTSIGSASSSVHTKDPSTTKYKYKMVEYTDSQVPTLAKGDEKKFERWYIQFEAFADNKKYRDMLSTKPHKDLPPEGELTPREDMSIAQKKAYRYHNKALNDLYRAFADNRTALAIMEKSKIDRGGTAEQNAKLRKQWPRGRVHRVIEELMREYRIMNQSRDQQQLDIDLRSLKLTIGASPQDLVEDIYDLQRQYQYKSVQPTMAQLIVAYKNALPGYLLMQLTPFIDLLQANGTAELEFWEALNVQAKSLYESARRIQSRGGKGKEMSLFGAEMTDFADPRDKWSTNAVCYWCKEKGHKAYNCPKRAASHTRADDDGNNNDHNGNNGSRNNNNNRNSNSGNNGNRGNGNGNSSGNGNGNSNGNGSRNNRNGSRGRRRKCGLCGGNHGTSVCFEDEKNASRRPNGWKSKLKDVQGATIDYDFCLSSMQTSTTSLQLLNAQKRATKGEAVPEGFDLLYDDNVFVFDTGATSHSSNSLRCATNLRASGATITTQ
eukprot:jgi/Psemu1/56321/gm1.56321_g